MTIKSAPTGSNGLAPHRRYTWWRHQMETFSALLAICAGNSPVPGRVNNREAGDLRRYRAHYDVIVMTITSTNIDQVLWRHMSSPGGYV